MLKTTFIVLGLLIILFLTLVVPVRASFLDDFNQSVQGLFGIKIPGSKVLSIEATITHAPEGDLNSDGVVDAGETVEFRYTISNTTDTSYESVTLNTHIPRDQINFIHEVVGAASLDDTQNTVRIPYLFILPQQTLTVSFRARLNYFTDTDRSVFTEPELLSKEKQQILKNPKKELRIRKFDLRQLPTMIKQNTP